MPTTTIGRALLVAAMLAVAAAGCSAPPDPAQTAPQTPPNTAPAPSPAPAPATPDPASPRDPAAACDGKTYSNCPTDTCIAQCVGSCDTCNDCDGPGSCVAKTSRGTSGRSPEGENPERQSGSMASCESFTYSSCPEGCVTACVGSCDGCDDCDGPGSCQRPQ